MSHNTTVTEVFTTPRVGAPLVLSGPAGRLTEEGQTLTFEVTPDAGFDGTLVLKRGRRGRGAFVVVAVFNNDSAVGPITVQSRSKFDQEFRFELTVESSGGESITGVLTDVDDIQRELPKPDKRSYLILRDSGIELPEGQNFLMTSPSTILRDGSEYEPLGISDGFGSLRFDGGGSLYGILPDGDEFVFTLLDALAVPKSGFNFGPNGEVSITFAQTEAFTLSDGSFTYLGVDGSGNSLLSGGLAQVVGVGGALLAQGDSYIRIVAEDIELQADTDKGISIKGHGGAGGSINADGFGDVNLKHGDTFVSAQAGGAALSTFDSVGMANHQFFFDVYGAIQVEFSEGLAGQVLMSGGPGFPATWQPKPLPDLYDDNALSGFTPPSATGDNSVAIGESAAAAGEQGLAVGKSALAPEFNTTAIGAGAETLDATDLAVGAFANAQGDGLLGAVAVGPSTNAFGAGTVAVGVSAAVSSDEGVSIGPGANVQASSDRAISIGKGAVTNGEGAIAIGDVALASFAGAIAIGDGASINAATGGDAVAIGAAAFVGNDANPPVVVGARARGLGRSVAIGTEAEAQTDGGVAVGYSADADGGVNVAVGHNTTASNAQGSVAVGPNLVVSGGLSAGFGFPSTTSKDYSQNRGYAQTDFWHSAFHDGVAMSASGTVRSMAAEVHIKGTIAGNANGDLLSQFFTGDGRLTIPASTIWHFEGEVVIREVADVTKFAVVTIRDGVITRDGSGNTTQTVAPTITELTDTVTNGITVSTAADDTNEALRVNVAVGNLGAAVNAVGFIRFRGFTTG